MIQTETRKAGPYLTNGVTTQFDFAFKVFETTDVVVTKALLSTGAETVLVEDTNYTITLNADQNVSPGGTITTVLTYDTGSSITISSDIPNTQGVDLTSGGGFYPDVIEDAFDRSVALVQQLVERNDRSLRAPVSDDEALDDLPPAVERASSFLAFDADGQPIASGGSPGSVAVSTYMETVLGANAAITAKGLLEIQNRNWLLNAGFEVAQRGTSFTSTTNPANNDDTYLFDQWILLSDGNDTVDVSQNTTAADLYPAARAGIKLDVETEDRKFGIFQILDAKRSAALWQQGGGSVSLSFGAKSSAAGLTLVRAAVLVWTGTADTVTSDPISAWNNEGTNPTLVANWAYANTPATLTALSSTPQLFEIEGIALNQAGVTNIGVLIWCDDLNTTVGDLLTISAPKLEFDINCSVYTATDPAEDFYACQEYFWRQTRETASHIIAAGYHSSTTAGLTHLRYPRMMRIAPTFSVSAVGDFIVTQAGSANIDTTNLTAATLTRGGATLSHVVAAGLTAGDGTLLSFDATAGGFIQFSAEL